MRKSTPKTSKDTAHTVPSGKRLLLRLLFLVPLGFSLILPSLLKNQRSTVEVLYMPLYPHIARFLETVTGWFSFSLCEFILYGFVAVTLLLLIRLIVRIVKRRLPLRALLVFFLNLALLCGIVLNLFYFTWGITYFREPLESRLSLSVTARSTEELEVLSRALLAQANSLRENLPEDAEGVFTADRAALLSKLPAAYSSLSSLQPVFSGPVSRVKEVALSRRLSVSNISGIYIGLTAEPNLNVDQPTLFLASDGAHELGHQLGNASENEAELSGILACMCSNDISVRYSGTMKALLRCMNALYSADRERFIAVYEGYSDGIQRDYSAYNQYWNRFSGPAAEIHDTMNDLYLKHNSVSSGIRSYGESVDLLLAVNDTAWGHSILNGTSFPVEQ